MSTSLLRQAVDVEHADRDLAEKREEFKKRMEVCKAKEEELQIRRQKINDRVLKFDKFLRENEAKRNRALKKYQQEVRDNERKSKELVKLNSELEDLKNHRTLLKKRLERYKIYETYLTRVIDIMPENYLEMTGDSMIGSIIQRHEGLSATNQSLVDRNHLIQTSIEESQKTVDDLKQENSKQKLIFNSQLASLQDQKEKLMETNEIREQRATMNHQKMRSLMGKLGQVLMGIDNLANQSHRRHWPALHKMSYSQKLSMVQEYLLERIGVEEAVKIMMAEAEIRSSSGHTFSTGKSIPSIAIDGVVSPESTFAKKHQVLPPITNSVKKSPSSFNNETNRHYKPGGNFLERLTAISEI